MGIRIIITLYIYINNQLINRVQKLSHHRLQSSSSDDS